MGLLVPVIPAAPAPSVRPESAAKPVSHIGY